MDFCRFPQTIVKEQGYEPPIHDFSIIRQEDGEDITDEVLDEDNYILSVGAHQLGVIRMIVPLT